MRSNLHAKFVRQIFNLAKIQYGRIDNGMLADRPQVWEINTNPILLQTREEYEAQLPLEIPSKEELSSTIGGCLNELDTSGDASGQSKSRKIVVK